MAEPAADYHRGEMEIHEQESTFHAFVGLTKWGSLALAVALVVLVLWFCTKAGFLGAAVTGVVLLAVGIFALREKSNAAH
jgi:flagellar biogenesis protein FliO